MGGWLGSEHPFLGFGLRRLSRLRGFIRLSHWGLLMAYRDFRRWLCSANHHQLVVLTSIHVGVSVTGLGVGWGTAGEVALTTRPPRTWFQPGPTLLLGGWIRPFRLRSGRKAFSKPPPYVLKRCLLSTRRLSLLPFTQPR